MTGPYPNQGLYIGGNVGNFGVAAGPNSTVSQRYVAATAATDDLGARLDELAGLIRANQEAIEDWEYALGDLDDIRALVGRPRPDRPRLRDTLARLGNRVVAALPVATAVTDLAVKISTVLK
jgi:hypothetical protein